MERLRKQRGLSRSREGKSRGSHLTASEEGGTLECGVLRKAGDTEEGGGY